VAIRPDQQLPLPAIGTRHLKDTGKLPISSPVRRRMCRTMSSSLDNEEYHQIKMALMKSKLHVRDWLVLARQSDFRASTLALKLKVSRWTLHRHIRKSFNHTPQAWLNKQRLILAAEMLKDCDSIKWLARELGYKTQAHFCHQFRRCYGLSPAQFRTDNEEKAACNAHSLDRTEIVNEDF